jgi:hypothetical protein
MVADPFQFPCWMEIDGWADFTMNAGHLDHREGALGF